MIGKATVIALLFFSVTGTESLAACSSGDAYQRVPMHIKRFDRDIVFEIPKNFEIRQYPNEDAFVINFSYPGFAPRRVNDGMLQPAIRLFLIGSETAAKSAADWQLSVPAMAYQRTEHGVDVYQETAPNTTPQIYYTFKDTQGSAVLFHDAGPIAVGYFYLHRLSDGIAIRGVVSKKITTPLPQVDADISTFIEKMICKEE